jgi:hypothetical protein
MPSTHDATKARILDEMFDVAKDSPITGAALNWLLVKVGARHGIAAPTDWPSSTAPRPGLDPVWWPASPVPGCMACGSKMVERRPRQWYCMRLGCTRYEVRTGIDWQGGRAPNLGAEG